MVCVKVVLVRWLHVVLVLELLATVVILSSMMTLSVGKLSLEMLSCVGPVVGHCIVELGI